MSDCVPRLTLAPRQEPCRARTWWDRESAVLRTTFTYPQRPTPEPEPLANRIDRQLGISARPYRVLLGSLDLLLEDRRRPDSLELRTNPAHWQRADLPDLPDKLDDVWAELHVDYDTNQIASLDLPLTLMWDSAGRRLALRFDPALVLARWYALADTVALGVTADDRLCELRLHAVAQAP